MKEKDYEEALAYIDRVDPDLLVLAWPSGPWGPLQTLGQKTPFQRAAKLVQKREENRMLLRFVRDASLAQRKRGGALLGENPRPSHGRNLSLKKPSVAPPWPSVTRVCSAFEYQMVLTFGRERGSEVQRRSPKGVRSFVTRAMNTPRVGGVKIHGAWMPLSEYAGGYNTNSAKEVALGAEQFLKKKRKQREVMVEGGEMAEEQILEEEEEEHEEQKEPHEEIEEEEMKKGARGWKVPKIPQRPGHREDVDSCWSTKGDDRPGRAL